MLQKRFGKDVAFDLEDLVDLQLVEARIPYEMQWDLRNDHGLFEYMHMG